MKTIRKYLRSRKSCKEILWLITKYVNQDTDKNYGTNKLVKLSDTELVKLKEIYGTPVTKEMINRLDWYIYKSGKEYVSHYITICNWCRKEWIEKIRPMYTCSYCWSVNRKWKECGCKYF